MASDTKPPFRADHVGSLLRPRRLLDARRKATDGEIGADELRRVEDDCITEVVAMQEEIGLKGVTDGELRRTRWHIDFLSQIDGVQVTEGTYPVSFKRDDGVEINTTPPTLTVTGKLRRGHPIQGADFGFLQSVTGQVAKVSIPSPSMLHFRGGRDGIDRKAYPDIDGFYDELADVYNAEFLALADEGARYLQLDDTNFAYLCDPAIREATRKLGEDPDELPRTYARLINRSIRGRPDDMAVCVHMCRGNSQSAWVAKGGYDPVAEILFNELDVDGLFLEYDDERSGDFSPLRFLPKGKHVVLGLVTSKWPRLEAADDLKHRIDEAARYAPLDQLALSPQCGFSSTVHGNALTIEDQIAKLRLVVDTALDVWGTL